MSFAGDGGGLKLPAIALSAVEGLDIVSTYSALQRPGAREANGIMAPIIHQPATVIAVKAGTTAGAIYLASRLHRQHPKVAKVLLWSLTGTMAGVVANNVAVLRR